MGKGKATGNTPQELLITEEVLCQQAVIVIKL